MKFWTAVACVLVIGGTTVAVHAKITRTVEKNFAVQPGGRLTVETQGGNITVKSDDANEVRVVVTQVNDAKNEEAATKLLEKLSLTLEQKGNDVSVVSTYAKRLGNLWGGWPPVQVSYTITVPRAFNLQLNTSGGNIQIERAGGPTSVSTSGGDIRILSAAQLMDAHTLGGNVSATLSEAPKQDMTLRTSGGNVTVSVPRTAAFDLDANTSGGEVRVDNLAFSNFNTNKHKTKVTATVYGVAPS